VAFRVIPAVWMFASSTAQRQLHRHWTIETCLKPAQGRRFIQPLSLGRSVCDVSYIENSLSLSQQHTFTSTSNRALSSATRRISQEPRLIRGGRFYSDRPKNAHIMSSKLIPANPSEVMVIRNITPNIATFSVPFARFGRIPVGGRGTLG
jgi:hypothetical protein